MLRLAQSLVDRMRASEIPPEDWKIVLQFMKALLSEHPARAATDLFRMDLPSETDDA